MNWSIVVAASKGYEPGLRAFLNSFEYYHASRLITVYLLSLELSEVFLSKYRDRDYLKIVDLEWVNHPQGERNTAWSTKIPRFKFASELDGVVRLADADMFFCANMDLYFRVAEAGFIVGGANGSNFRFHQDWRDKYQIDVPDCFDYKTICSVPTIMDTAKHGAVWKSLYDHKMTIGTGADFDLQNIFIVVHDKLGFILSLPSQQTTGIHHFMLKQNTRVIRKENKLMTADGLEVLTVHGKWWQSGWFDNLLTKMEGYCKGNEQCVKEAWASRRILKNEFDQWLDF